MLIIDRFEGNIAICEKDDGTITDLPRTLLSPDCQEGDCIDETTEGIFRVLEEETRQRRQEIEERFLKLFGK